MKHVLRIVLLIILALSLAVSACVSDGVDSAELVLTGSNATTVKVVIKDAESGNGIYISRTNNQVYCADGPDRVINLPGQANYAGVVTQPDATVLVEVVCMWGQQKFDAFLELFPGETDPAP